MQQVGATQDMSSEGVLIASVCFDRLSFCPLIKIFAREDRVESSPS